MSMIITAIVVLLGLALIFGAVLGFAAVRFKVDGDPIVDQINSPFWSALVEYTTSDSIQGNED